MQPSSALTETQHRLAVEKAVLALKKLTESPKLKELRKDRVLENNKSGGRHTWGFWGEFGLGGISFDTNTLLLTPSGIVDHREHTDGQKQGGEAMCTYISNHGTTGILRHEIVTEARFESIVEEYNLDAVELENTLRRIES